MARGRAKAPSTTSMALKKKKSAQGADKIPDNDTVTQGADGTAATAGPSLPGTILMDNGGSVTVHKAGGVGKTELSPYALRLALDQFEPEGPEPPADAPLFAAEAVTGAPGAAGAGKDLDGTPLDKLSLAELLEMRNDINKLLPPTEIEQINLEEELALQYHLSHELLMSTLASAAEPNQKASTVSACNRVLGDLVKMQTELYNAERQKMMEVSLERAFVNSGVSIEVRKRFVDLYATGLRELAAGKDKEKPRTRVVMQR